ncbi:ABC transporter substrate-binding protein [Streptosporangium amethystogenes subsp. fukuiense]|uniref:ABC transporter substrate-binding protein n=1 Tax=Streptosporangium amethystogenes subsp. fukuiense TaxID=698418 RepID=A0ABW2TAJ4_9ACTN
MRPSLRLMAVAMPLALTLATAACGGDSGATEKREVSAFSATGDDALAAQLKPKPLAERKTIKIGISSIVGSYAAVALADSLGEFEKENIQIRFEFLQTQDALVMMTQGKVDVLATQVSPGLLNLIASGEDIRIVFPGGGRPESTDQGLYVNKSIFGDNGKFDLTDLKGVKLAGPGGNRPALWASLFEHLKSNNVAIGPKDVEWQDLTSADSVNALRNGAVGAAYASTPHQKVVADDACCEFVKGAIAPTTGVFYMFDDRLIKEDRETGLAFTRAMARTTQKYLLKDYRQTKEVVAALAAAQKIPEDSIRTTEPSAFEADYNLHTENASIYQGYYRDIDSGLLQYKDDLGEQDLFNTSFAEELKNAG